MSNQYLSFDVTKQSAPQQLITGRQGDSQLKFVTMLFWDGDKNVPYDLTGKQVAFEALKPDNTHIVDHEGITVLDAPAGLVRYSFNEQVFAVAGTMQQAFFKITHTDSDNNVIADSTLEVAINILENRVEFGINSKDYLSEYDKLVADVEKKFDDYATTVQKDITQAQAIHEQIVEYTNLINANQVITKANFGDIGSIKQPLGNTAVDKLNNEFTDRGVNVKWFGAVGDGVADDTSAVNAAINYATNQGVTKVYLPAGSYRITSSIILPNQFTLQGAGDSANNTGATEIIKDGDFDAIWIKGSASRVSGITVTGSVGNSGDGIWVTGSRAMLAEVEVTGQGGNGIRIGNKVAGTNYNANLFDLSNVIITKCQDGLNIHDENNHDLPNAGSGTIYHLDVRECNRGLYINASIDTVLYNPVVQLCKTANIYLDEFCKSAKFFGFYTEYAPTEIYIAEGARRNYMIAQRDNQPMIAIEDHGTQTFILGRDMQNDDKLAMNKIQFNELEISNPKISGRWSLSQDAVNRDLIIDMIGSSATDTGVRLKKGLYLGKSKINNYLARDFTVNFGFQKANTVSDMNVNVVGIIKGDVINVSVKQPLPAGVILTSAASFSDGTVTLRAANLNDSDITIGNITVKIGCFQ